MTVFPWGWSHRIGSRANKSSTSHAHVSSCSDCCLSSTSPSSSSLWSPCCSFCPTPSTSTMSWTNTLRTSAEDLGTLAENEPPTGYEPNDHFITEAYVEYTQESTGEQRSTNETSTSTTSPSARRSLTRAEDEPITLKKKACRPVCRRQSVMIERRDPLFVDLCRAPKKLRDTTLEVNRSGLSWKDKGSRFSLTVKQRFENTNSRLITTAKVFKSWRKRSSRQKKKFVELIKEMNNYWSKIGIFVKFMRKVSMRWKNWSDFKGLHSRQLREKIDLTSRYYPWTHWNQLYERFERFSGCWISTQVDNPIHTSSSSWWNAQPFKRNAEPQKMGRQAPWNIHGISGNVFVNPTASSSAPYPQELNPWSSYISENIHSSQTEKSENQTTSSGSEMPVRDRQPKIHSSLVREILQRTMGQTNNDCRFQIFISTKFPTPATFACWKIRFKTEVCTCSQVPMGSYAVDRRSGVGWFTGWSKIFVLWKRNSNARFWSTRCEDCFSIEQNHP